MMFFIWILFLYFYWDTFFYFLILVEGFMVIIFSFFVIYNSFVFFSFEIVSMFLAIIVIEGIFGISILLYVVFIGGHDKYNFLSFF